MKTKVKLSFLCLVSSALVGGICASAAAAALTPGQVEVVIEPKANRTVAFAADELTNGLARVLGALVPIVRAPTKRTGFTSIFLGDSEWSRAAGLDVASLGQDAYFTKVEKSCVYICGKDDAQGNPRAALAPGGGYGNLIRHDKATLFGVYGFLEEKAGMRFYLPDDELGVIAPRKASIDLAEGRTVTAPNFLIREPYMGGDGEWYCEKSPSDRSRVKSLEWLRLRMTVAAIPCCHGSRDFKYIERFGETNPEFMALKKNGKRWLDPNVFAAYQLCWTNPELQETMYQDIKAYLTGQPASSRGLKHWGNNCRDGRYVDIMPEDSFQGCFCERCQAAYVRRPGDRHYATELMWGIAAKFAQRLQDEKIRGDVVLMSYPPYGRVPDFNLPTNVQVMVAKTGPWALVNPTKAAEEDAVVKEWTEKLGHKVWVWTYPHKFGGTMIKGVPCMAPHAWGRYFKQMSPWIFGTFAESESDKAIYNHLNYYVFSCVAWNADADVNAIVREYHELMFGPAAEEMRAFNALLERKWLKEVAGRIEETPVGPVAKAPSAYQLWREVYSKEVRDELSGYIRAAVAKVEKGSLEKRRIELMYREFLKPILSEAAAYEKATDVQAAQARRAKAPNRSILPPLGAKGFWGGTFDVDTNDCVTAAGAVHFSSKHTASVRVSLSGHAAKGYPEMKPNTRYRLSYFVKVRGVTPIKIPGGSSGGVSVNIWDDRNRWFPSSSSTPKGNFFTGTMDWIYQEFEFTSGSLTCNVDPAKGAINHSYLQLHILYGAGEAWFDDLRLEEIEEK